MSFIVFILLQQSISKKVQKSDGGIRNHPFEFLITIRNVSNR